MSDRTDEATRDPSAPEPEPEPERILPPSPRRSPTAREPTLVPIDFTEWFDREFEGDLRPGARRDFPASTRPRHPSTCRPTSTWRRWSNVTRRARGRRGRRGRREWSAGSSAGRPNGPPPTGRRRGSCRSCHRVLARGHHRDHDERRPPQPVVVDRDLVFDDTTPTGGDFGAHVWGPAYLRDHLLPSWRLNGWSMDWYAGMPAYRFYMVVPALAIVALDTVLAVRRGDEGRSASSGCSRSRQRCWAFGRLGRFRYPMPELFAFAGLAFAARRELQHLRRQPQVDDGGRVLVLDRAVARRARRSACCRPGCAPASTACGRRCDRRGVLFARHRADLRRLRRRSSFCLVWIDRTRLVYAATVGRHGGAAD